jgi:hypothetical protein
MSQRPTAALVRSLWVASAVVLCLALLREAAANPDEATIASNEAAALGDLRTIMSAEEAYQFVNSGLYDAPACLLAPARCIPGYPENAPTFLDEAVAALTVKDGYGRAFISKPPAQEPGVRASPSSVGFYAVLLWPDEPGETGRRAFCGDAGGVICFTEDGKAPKVGRDGRCPALEEPDRPAGCEVLY